jgi:hypothetical protein
MHCGIITVHYRLCLFACRPRRPGLEIHRRPEDFVRSVLRVSLGGKGGISLSPPEAAGLTA